VEIEKLTDAELEQAIYECINEQLGKKLKDRLLKERKRRNKDE